MISDITELLLKASETCRVVKKKCISRQTTETYLSFYVSFTKQPTPRFRNEPLLRVSTIIFGQCLTL